MKNEQPWVPPLKTVPLSIKPIAMMQQKHFGSVLNPTRWWGRMPRLFWLVALFVGYLERKNARLDPTLRALLMTRVSQQCACAFCIDANSLRLAQRSGGMEKVLAVAEWRESTLFSAPERAVLDYADAVTATPPQVTSEQQIELHCHFSDAQIVEMTALLAFQNLSARFNAALDIPSQGLCIPPGEPHA